MKNFEEMEYKQFRMIGLHPLKNLERIKEICKIKHGVCAKNSKSKRYFLIKEDKESMISCIRKICGDHWYNEKDFILKEFDFDGFTEIPKDLFEFVIGENSTSLSKYLWLQDYLRGNVDGIYIKPVDDTVRIYEQKLQEERIKFETMKDIMTQECEKYLNEIKTLKEENKKLKKYKKIIEEIKKIELLSD